MSARYVDIPVDRARYRGTLMYRLHQRLNVGIEWNPGASEVCNGVDDDCDGTVE